MKKRLTFLAALSAVGVSLVEMYRFGFCRNRGLSAIFVKKTHSEEYFKERDRRREEFLKRPKKQYIMKNDRGQRLVGYYYCAGDRPSGKIAFIVHGVRSDHAESAGAIAQLYFSRGWDIFACDHVSHGESQGELIGYDYFESLACLEWLDVLRQAYGKVPVILHGFSMGGGTVLKMSDRVPDNVKFIVSDSGFSDAATLIRNNIPYPIYKLMRNINKLLGGYDIEETDVKENLLNSKAPILFVHGRADPTVPFEMSEKLYELCPTEKDCLFTQETPHIETIYRFPEEYAEKIDNFIEKYVDEGEKNEV